MKILNLFTPFFLIIIVCFHCIECFPADKYINYKSREITPEASYSPRPGYNKEVNVFSEHPAKYDSGWLCKICKLVSALVQEYVAMKRPEDEIADLLTKVCIDLKIEDRRVCIGIIQEFRGEFFGVLDKAVLTPSDICGTYIGESCAHVVAPYGPWNVTLPTIPKPPVIPIPPPKVGSPVSKVLHLSDTHFDPEYEEGSNTHCGEPLCCRKGDGLPPKGVPPAGKFGYWNCDTPHVTLTGLYEHITNTHKDLDYIIWTGDVPPHNVWNQSRSDQVNAIIRAVKLFQQYFPDTKVYPAVGNHESAPVNSFPPPWITGNQSNSWLLDALADAWSAWLPEDTKSTIQRGGYYTVLVRKGLRIVSLNINYCSKQNYWLLIDNEDPAGQLAWLIDVLQEAENNKEKVHILGHIPVGTTTCLKHWSWNYYKIIDRYEGTVTAQFFGHTHHDEFEIFYDEKTLKVPTNIMYIGPSVTPYTMLNPGYRMYDVDGDYAKSSKVVLNHYTWTIDLEKANKLGVATWQLEYNAKDAYNMTSLLPKDWNKLINRMDNDDKLFQLFYKYVWKSHVSACDASCKKSFLCRLRSGRSYDEGSFCNFKNHAELKYHRRFSEGLEKC